MLLITLDTLRADRLGAYGDESGLTPVLDDLATRGTTFEQAQSPCPMTLPTHTTILTGLDPPEHGVLVNGRNRVGEDTETLAGILADQGYETGAFIAAFVLDEKFGLARGFDVYDDDLSAAYEQDIDEPLSVYRSGAHVVDAALDWLDRVAPNNRQTSDAPKPPFFAWVHLYDPHLPYQSHPELKGTALEGEATYAAEIAFVDQQVGRLLAFLDEHRLREKTLVIAVADHGEGLGDHGEVDHGHFLYDTVVQVPLIVSLPGQVREDHRVNAIVPLKDLLPTVLDLVETDEPGHGRGRSLRAALEGRDIDSRPAYAETRLPLTNFGWSPQQSLTEERWKYVRTPRPELFDRAADPDELFNLASARPEQRDLLERRLTALEATMTPGTAAKVVLDAEERARLEALGYVVPDTEPLSEATSGEKAGSEATGTSRPPRRDMKTMLPVKHLAARVKSASQLESTPPAELLSMARRLVEASPETATFQRDLGWALLRQGDGRAAIEHMRTAVELDPGVAASHFALAEALYQENNQDPESTHHFREALRIDPELAPVHLGLGNALAARDQRDLAAGHYFEAIRLQPKMAEAHYNLARNLVARKRPDKAIPHFKKAVEIEPEWSEAHFELAGALRELGRPEDAVEHYEIALELAPSAETHNNMGVALVEAGRSEEGLAQYRQALEIHPEFHRPHMNLGNFFASNERWPEAIQHYKEAARVRPNSPVVVRQLAWVLATCPDEELRDGAAAVELAERAHELNPHTSALILHTLAAAYAESGQLSRASETAQEAVRLARARGNITLVQEIEERRLTYQGTSTGG